MAEKERMLWFIIVLHDVLCGTSGIVNLALDKLPAGRRAHLRVRVEEKHRLMSVLAAVDESAMVMVVGTE